MRIGMLSPVGWPVPPEGYGPWEQVVHNLTEELAQRGHEVTLFAAPGSKTRAALVETVPHPFSLWPRRELERPQALDPETGLLAGPPDFRALEQMHIAACMESARMGAFDLVHSHLHVHALVFGGLIDCPMVSTLHGSAWVQADHPVLDRYKHTPFVSISNAERGFKPDLNYVATVYNGIDVSRYPFRERKRDYLLFSGRIAPEKGVAEAIRIAKGAGMPLKIAGMVEEAHRDYFDREIQPHLDGSGAEYVGLLPQTKLAGLYQNAKALLCPVRWAEPFGLVTAESMACGTPVIASRRGAFVETVRHGETGYLFDTPEEGIRCVRALGRIDPGRCREDAERRFSSGAMCDGYIKVYENLIG